VRLLPTSDAIAFLGGAPAVPGRRRQWYESLRPTLSPGARRYWDRRARAVAQGVLGAGVSERFMSLLTWVVRLAVHPPRRIRRLLACTSLEEQRALYDGEWNSRRWRLLYRVLLSRSVFNRTYDPAFFRHVENPSFAQHFHRLAEHTLTDLPVTNNYFLHYALTGRYPLEVPDGLPPYLVSAGADVLRAGGSLDLVDAPLTQYLRTLPHGSVDGFVLSNIGEWLDATGLDALFAQVARTATPGARVCFRNFVGWTEVPPRWRDVIVEDRARGEALILRDRSMVNRRIAACQVRRDPS
jgi:S-adenosylmethionine-diacylglycerol 3-amino-3-carboxypropyl transferase